MDKTSYPKTANPNKVNYKHVLFVDNLIANKFNATIAYKLTYGVGYESAMVEASRLLRNDKIEKMIEDRLRELDIKNVVTIEFVLNNLVFQALNAKKSSDKIRANELLGKYLAMFTEKQEVLQVDKEDNQFSLEKLSRIKHSEEEKKINEG